MGNTCSLDLPRYANEQVPRRNMTDVPFDPFRLLVECLYSQTFEPFASVKEIESTRRQRLGTEAYKFCVLDKLEAHQRELIHVSILSARFAITKVQTLMIDELEKARQ